MALAAAACQPVVPEDDAEVNLDVPDSVSDLLDATWLDFDSPDPARMAALAGAVPTVVDVEALKDPGQWPDGEQRRFTEAHLDKVQLYPPPPPHDAGWSRPDPALARPVFIASRYACSLDQLARILVERDQDSLYDAAYETYVRTWAGDGDAFLRGEVDGLSWTFDMTTSYPGAGQFDEFAHGEIRRVPLPEGMPGVAGGTYLLTRVWLPYPAALDNDGLGFDQDYQLELYLPYADGTIVHVYGVWRQLTTPFGDFEGDLVSRLTVNNLKDWDKQTAALCAEGRP